MHSVSLLWFYKVYLGKTSITNKNHKREKKGKTHFQFKANKLRSVFG